MEKISLYEQGKLETKNLYQELQELNEKKEDENNIKNAVTNEADYKKYVDTGLYCYDEANGVDRIVKANENDKKGEVKQAQ